MRGSKRRLRPVDAIGAIAVKNAEVRRFGCGPRLPTEFLRRFNTTGQTAKGLQMGAEENKAVFRRFVEEVPNKRNLDAVDEFCDENVVFRFPAGGGISGSPFPDAVEGRQALKERIIANLAPFSDLQVEVDRLIAEDDFVSAVVIFNATMAGEFMGQDVSGKKVSFPVAHTLRFSNGRIVEDRPISDSLVLMMQLGLTQIPQPA